MTDKPHIDPTRLPAVLRDHVVSILRCEAEPHVIEDGVAIVLQAADLLERLSKDAARLDFLDECNRRLNAHYGTRYAWNLVLSHNITNLMLGRGDASLYDSCPGSVAHGSCRGAIDERMDEAARARAAKATGSAA